MYGGERERGWAEELVELEAFKWCGENKRVKKGYKSHLVVPGMMEHTCNPSTQNTETGDSPGYTVRPYLKGIKSRSGDCIY